MKKLRLSEATQEPNIPTVNWDHVHLHFLCIKITTSVVATITLSTHPILLLLVLTSDRDIKMHSMLTFFFMSDTSQEVQDNCHLANSCFLGSCSFKVPAVNFNQQIIIDTEQNFLGNTGIATLLAIFISFFPNQPVSTLLTEVSLFLEL